MTPGWFSVILIDNSIQFTRYFWTKYWFLRWHAKQSHQRSKVSRFWSRKYSIRQTYTRITERPLLRSQLVRGTLLNRMGTLIYARTRGWLTITVRVSASFWGTWFASYSKIRIWVPPNRMFFGAFQGSWICLGPLFTDLRSYERTRRLLVHNGVTWSWHFLYSSELDCVSKVWPIHQCARAYSMNPKQILPSKIHWILVDFDLKSMKIRLQMSSKSGFSLACRFQIILES